MAQTNLDITTLKPGDRCWFRLWKDDVERRGRVLKDLGEHFGLKIDEDETGIAHRVSRDDVVPMVEREQTRLEEYGDVEFTRMRLFEPAPEQMPGQLALDD